MVNVQTLRIGSATLEDIIDDKNSGVPLLIRPTYAWSSVDLDRLNRGTTKIPAADKPEEFIEFTNREMLVRFTRLFVDEQKSLLKAIRNMMGKLGVMELRIDVPWGKSRKEITVKEEWTAGDVHKLIFKP